MKYHGSLWKQTEQWFNEHFKFDASHIPDTDEAYPEYDKFCNDFVNSITYDDAKKCLEDLNSQRYDYDKLGIEWTTEIYVHLKSYADHVTWDPGLWQK
jgi:hypothetical protein